MAYKHVLRKLITPTTFILIGAVARIIPHAPNFTPIGAMALFGGSKMNKKQALVLPILAMIVSDFFIGFDSIISRLTVYGSFLLIVMIGIKLRKNPKPHKILASSLLASILFFVITNFSVWAFGSIYTKDLAGLIECYTYAVPFFRNTIMGDLFYSFTFFGGFSFAQSLAKRKFSALLNS